MILEVSQPYFFSAPQPEIQLIPMQLSCFGLTAFMDTTGRSFLDLFTEQNIIANVAYCLPLKEHWITVTSVFLISVLKSFFVCEVSCFHVVAQMDYMHSYKQMHSFNQRKSSGFTQCVGI